MPVLPATGPSTASPTCSAVPQVHSPLTAPSPVGQRAASTAARATSVSMAWLQVLGNAMVSPVLVAAEVAGIGSQ